MDQVRVRVAQSWASHCSSVFLDKSVRVCFLYLEQEYKCWFHTRISKDIHSR